MSRLTEARYLGAYWGDRAEELEECTERLTRCLSSIGAVSSLFTGWRPQGRSLNEAVASPLVAPTELVELLKDGVNRRDSDGSAIPELGFRWSAWNGSTELAVSVSVTCGATATRSGVLNAFVLGLPEFEPSGPNETNGNAVALLTGVVDAWEPDWAVVTSHELRESLVLERAQPTVGWLTYVGDGRDAGGLGEGFNSGTLIQVADTWPDVRVDDVAAVAASLDRNGALTPIGL